MKKILIFAAILLSIAAIALFMFHPYFNSMAEQDYPYEGEEPDLPAFLKNKGDKLQFMMRRAEGIGLKRGIDKNPPAGYRTNGASAGGSGEFARIGAEKIFNGGLDSDWSGADSERSDG
jgi:hypothetical protein